MRRIDWSNSAVRDLAKIRVHIARSNPHAAKRMILKLQAAITDLAEYPERGRPAARGNRELTTVAPYIVRYRVMKDCVRIGRIRHSARRPLT